MAKPVTDDEREEIIALIRSGLSRSDIVKRTGRGSSTITRIAASIDHDWLSQADARTQSSLVRAHNARSAYSAERRAGIAARLTEEAELLLDQLHEPHVAFNFGGKDNDYNEHEMAEPPIESKRALIQATREAMRTVIDISRHDTKADENNAAGLVTALVDSLRASVDDA